MTISATVVADSISPLGIRITTMVLRYPRFIHAEFMTHRMFSRNASSSRAIPIEKMIKAVEDEPAMPVYWGKNQKGMQAAEELSDVERAGCETEWLEARNSAVKHAKTMLDFGLHKQLTNRLLEPWQHITVICTATEWTNFYALRRHKDAQPEIKALADCMHAAQNASLPMQLRGGEWHLPFICNDDMQYAENLRVRMSVARCARVSYLNHDGTTPNMENDMKLYDRLILASPAHMTPAEHQCVPMTDNSFYGNLRGWKQHRKFIIGESGT
jgi:thymidylate synthase ThyX